MKNDIFKYTLRKSIDKIKAKIIFLFIFYFIYFYKKI